MAAIQSTEVTLADAFASRTAFKLKFGFPPVLTPLIVALGVGFLVASVPGLFVKIHRTNIRQRHARAVIDFLFRQSQRVNDAQNSRGVVEAGDLALKVAIVGLGAVLVAALVRSILARRWLPLGVVAAGFGLGLFSLPAIAWLVRASLTIFKIGNWIADSVQRLIRWAAPVLSVVLLVAFAVGALWLIYEAVRYIIDNDLLAAVMVGVAVVAVVGGLIWGGVLDGVLAWLGSVAEAIGRFLDRYVAPVVSWIIRILFVLVVAVAALGVVLGSFGQLGRSLFVPAISAAKAGRGTAHCADMAVGLGLTVCVILCASALDRQFGIRFATVWESIPVLSSVPSPSTSFHAIIPDSIETWARPAFNGYQPLVDAFLMAIVSVVGTLGLLFTKQVWRDARFALAVAPMMSAVGLGLVVIVPLIILGALVNSEAGS